MFHATLQDIDSHIPLGDLENLKDLFHSLTGS